MESATIDHDINAIKEVRELLNKRRSNLSLVKKQKEVEKNFVNMKLFISF